MMYLLFFMPENLYMIHTTTSLIIGFTNYILAYFINKFISRVIKNARAEDITVTHPIWVAISKYRNIFHTMSLMLYFNGTGRLIAATVKWNDLYDLFIIVNCANSIFAIMLSIQLFKLFWGSLNE